MIIDSSNYDTLSNLISSGTYYDFIGLLSDSKIVFKIDDKKLLNHIKFFIVLDSNYIEVYDKDNNLVFTREDYNLLKKKLSGIDRYNTGKFIVSKNLYYVPDIDNSSMIDDSFNKKRLIDKALPDDLDLIDTGSTGRGTNINYSSDFDFVMIVDHDFDKEDMNRRICKKLNLDYDECKNNKSITEDDNIRFREVNIPGIEEPMSIDISYIEKGTNYFYSTDMALKDRLDNIKENNYSKYEDVLDNIIEAKRFCKNIKAYKPSHSTNNPEGGLGGVGVENWILQNGGSFYDACIDFDSHAYKNNRLVPFNRFKDEYQIYDAGRNFYKGRHDEFVSDNMTESGYKKLATHIHKYLDKISQRELRTPKRGMKYFFKNRD